MCTDVVGGSIHRAATSISTASDQRSAPPMRIHRTKFRRELFRFAVFEAASGFCAVFGATSGFSVTLQNNRLRSIAIAPVQPHNLKILPSTSNFVLRVSQDL